MLLHSLIWQIFLNEVASIIRARFVIISLLSHQNELIGDRMVKGQEMEGYD